MKYALQRLAPANIKEDSKPEDLKPRTKRYALRLTISKKAKAPPE